MWSENSCGCLCIQVWGKTMLNGSGSDSTPLPCLYTYQKKMWICIAGPSVFVCVYFLLLSIRFYFWLLLNFCRPCLDTEFMYWGQHSDMTTKSLKKHLPPSSHNIFPLVFTLFFLPSIFANSLMFSQPSTIWNTYCFSLTAGSYEELWLYFIKVVLSWRINAIGNSHFSCLYDTHVAFNLISMLC